MPIIAVLNHSKVMTDDIVKKHCDAVNKQIIRDFAPAWGMTGALMFKKPSEVKPSDWIINYMDSPPKSDEPADYLGYHDESTDGRIEGFVFAKLDMQYKLLPSVTFSHEVLEMIGDPYTNLNVLYQDDTKSLLYSAETCDAVEDDSLSYLIDGVAVSNFIYPSWFDQYAKPGTIFDYRKVCSKPFEIIDGGYSQCMDLNNIKAGWTSITKGCSLRYLLKNTYKTKFARTFRRMRTEQKTALTKV